MAIEHVRPGIRRTPIPPFADWIASRAQLRDNINEPSLQHLHQVVANLDATVIRVDGEYRRFCRVPEVDVFFQTGNKRYKIKEVRTTVNPGRDVDEVLEQVKGGDRSGV